MRNMKRIGACALAAVMALGMMSGCSRLENKSEQDTVIATFDGEDIMLDYVMYQMRSAQYGYEQMFSMWYGTTDFWSQAYDETTTIESYVKESIMATIRQTKVLCDYAEKNGIELTEEQLKKVDEAVETAMSADQEYLDLLGATEELMREVVTENALANAVYLALVADVDTTVGDEEFIRKDITYVRLAPTDLEEESSEAVTTAEDTTEAGEEETGTAADEADAKTADEAETSIEAETSEEAQTTVEATTADAAAVLAEKEAAQKEAMEEAAKEIEERLNDGELPADFISEYNEDTTYFTATHSTSTIGDDSTYVYTETAFALGLNEVAVYADESTGGVYVLMCTNDNNTEARQTAIESEIESRKADLFVEKYAAIQEESPEFKVDEDVMAQITFSTALYVPETTEAASVEETTVEETTAEEATVKETTEAETGEADETADSEVKTSEEETEVTTEAE
ncbi:MAG: hypothetical protein IJ468_08960 [Lachnospiraceae bacterium]|nr:hypothetical protein [Lachnospiraceae bacterium]